MVICPACKSSEIRNDYKPALFLFRIVGIRALLCDNCNHQFKAFSPRPPKRTRHHARLKTATSKDALSVDLNQLRRKVAEAQIEKASSINWVKLSLRPAPSGEVVPGQVLPVRSDLQTQILKLHQQTAQELLGRQPVRELTDSVGQEHSPLQCPGCGSTDVQRRHRTKIERAALSLTNHKAFQCRDCSASFYAKSAHDEGTMNVSDAGIFGPSGLSPEHKG